MSSEISQLKQAIVKLQAERTQLSNKVVRLMREISPLLYVVRANSKGNCFMKSGGGHDVCLMSTKALADAVVSDGNSSPGSLKWHYSVHTKDATFVPDKQLLSIDEIPDSFPYDD